VAVTVCAALIATMHVPVPEQPPPDQPVKSESLAAAAVRVTEAPELNANTHVAPQLIPAGAEVTVPEPPPARFTVSANVEGTNVAVTVRAALIVTVQVPVPEQPPPDHPAKSESLAGAAVSVTVAPEVNVNAHVAPQLIPAGDEVTVPLPAPAGATVNVNCGTKLAVTVAVAFIVTTHCPVPEQPAPDHPWNTEPDTAAAVRVTCEFVVKAAVQVAPQSMPAGDEVTLPEPVPVRFTVRLNVPRPNVAVTPVAALIGTTHWPVPEHPPPDHPWNVNPGPGFAESVTGDPSLKLALQVDPQLMPEGADVTVPVPGPALVTVRTCWTMAKLAVTLVALLMVTEHGPVPAQPATPDQPVNDDPAAGVAVRRTLEPTLKLEAQVAPQLIPAGVEVTVPLPAPLRVTVSAAVATSKLAVAVAAPFSVKVHVALDPEQAPDQPVKVEPGDDTVAVSVTLVPTLKVAAHVAPQLMPAGVEVTVPLPAPVLLTASCAVGIVNVAVTVVAEAMTTLQVRLLPEHPPPDHEVNTEPACGAAVKVTVPPTWKLPLQVAPQLMPAGDEVTVPEPVPVLVTVSTRVSILNAAPTLCGLFGIEAMVQVGLVPEAAHAPDHPPNTEPVGTVAVRVTLEATLNVPAQVAPQLIGPGEEVTVPVPAPDLETVIVLVSCVKVAVTACAPPPTGIVMTQLPVPLQAPLQPVNCEPAAALADNVTEELLAKLSLHALPQLMAPGLPAVEVTVPLPVPAFVTVTGDVFGAPTWNDCVTCGAAL